MGQEISFEHEGKAFWLRPAISSRYSIKLGDRVFFTVNGQERVMLITSDWQLEAYRRGHIGDLETKEQFGK